ncbi:ATP-dependent nuclease [Mycobacteroides abscessus]|uniref:ATP-dependent nuclease n=1 Tax=Mycobacteroides abscessus TaxID=36809 RepID=UPI002107354A|nr:AAA family ATPase [Mycobacteroides abscessus]
MTVSPSEVQKLRDRVRTRGYQHYLYDMELKKVRGFENASIRFDFPVTALVGPNGAGKTTVLGAAGLIYEKVAPRRFFARSGSYDGSMSGWRVEYNMGVDGATVPRTASYTERVDDTRRSKWNRKAVARPVKVIGVNRTLPVSERSDVYKFAKGDFVGVQETRFKAEVTEAVERILGKAAADYLEVAADSGGKYSILARKPVSEGAGPAYSEFHFGAGEASIIRIVGEVEAVDDNALILIEEVENGLHPLATQRLVEYLVSVCRRKGCQVIFTTHSNAALKPLPGEAVWSAYRGQLTQGKLDIESLRALTGEIDTRLAVFSEDRFGSLMAEVTLRRYGDLTDGRLDLRGIEIHALGGAAPARDQARHNNNNNPARTFYAVAILDGDKCKESGYNPADTPSLRSDKGAFVTFFPGDGAPEAEILDAVDCAVKTNGKVLPRLTLALQMDTVHQEEVRQAIADALLTNTDRHTVFSDIGESLDFLSEMVTARAFVATWANFHDDEVKAIWDPVADYLPRLSDAATT